LSEFIDRLHALSLTPVVNLLSLKNNTKGYLIDTNVQNLLAFHPSYPLTTMFPQEYSSGTVILQDKASCIPADLLDARQDATVLDACAAPGNKTTQLAAAIGGTGHVIAVEKDSKRAVTLKTMVGKAGASTCITPSLHF
jgi:putative methyltransferase